MASHLLRFHESVDKAYARPSDAFADLRRIAREVPSMERDAILHRLFDTSMRERRPFLSFHDRRIGVFIGSPWCIWEEWGAPEEHLPFLQRWTNLQLQNLAANMIRRVRDEIPLLTTARAPLLASFPKPQWYIVAQHVREWFPNEKQRIAVLPFHATVYPDPSTQLRNSTLLQTHCPDFAAWLSLVVDPNEWTKDLIVSAAQGYFTEAPPLVSSLPDMANLMP